MCLARALGGYYNRMGKFVQTMQLIELRSTATDRQRLLLRCVVLRGESQERLQAARAEKLTYILKGIEATVNPGARSGLPGALVYRTSFCGIR
jgi:hypothetical protein